MRKTEQKLKSCPFCGNPYPEIVVYPPNGVERFRMKYAVLCRFDPGCGAESGHWHSAAEAVYMWNQRKRKWRG